MRSAGDRWQSSPSRPTICARTASPPRRSDATSVSCRSTRCATRCDDLVAALRRGPDSQFDDRPAVLQHQDDADSSNLASSDAARTSFAKTLNSKRPRREFAHSWCECRTRPARRILARRCRASICWWPPTGAFCGSMPTPPTTDRDRFILSKGHAAAALYATLAERGFFPARHAERRTAATAARCPNR